MASSFGSLRVIFGLIGVAGLAVAIVMTGLLIRSAQTSDQIVNQAQLGQKRLETLLRLQYTLDYFQTTSSMRFSALPAFAQGLEEARSTFVETLDEIVRVPLESAAQRRAFEAIHAKGLVTLALFDNRGGVQVDLDSVWEEHGHQAGLDEVRRIYADYFEFKDMIRNQILLEDQLLEETVIRAQSFQRSITPIALLCLILAVLGYGALLVLVWTRLNPGLRKLERGVQEFGAGRLDHRIDLGGRDELARLSNAFDSMAQQLAQKQTALQDFAARQEAAVAARTRELEKANKALAATDERRRAFFADVSHELRTPLTIIRGEAQIALRKLDRGGVDSVAVLDRILSLTRNLSRLVDDLFLIARAEAGGLALRREELEISELTARLAQDFSSIAQEVGARVVVETRAPTRAVADADRLRQMLMAVMDNALRHAPAPLVITLTVWEEESWSVVRVSDNGPGFALDAPHELFTRFRRGKVGGEGSGLGLTLVRALAEAQGGRVSLSNRPGGGAAVTIRLPNPRAAHAPEPANAVSAAG